MLVKLYDNENISTTRLDLKPDSTDIGGTSGTTELITFISSFPMSKVGSAETVPEIYIEFDAIREKGPDYIIIDWQGKEIRLLRSEYKYRGITSDGKPFILIYKDIYQYKF